MITHHDHGDSLYYINNIEIKNIHSDKMFKHYLLLNNIS